MSNNKLIDMGELQIKALITSLEPSGFVCALNNAFCHGDAFIIAGYEGGLDSKDKNLQEWFKCIERMAEIAKAIENFTVVE